MKLRLLALALSLSSIGASLASAQTSSAAPSKPVQGQSSQGQGQGQDQGGAPGGGQGGYNFIPPKFSITLTPRARGFQESSLGGSSSDLGIGRTGLDLGLSYFYSPQWIVLAGFSYENNRYAWKNLGALVPGQSSPIRNGQILNANVGLVHNLNEKWSIVGGFTVRRTGETTATNQSQETGFSLLGQYSTSRTSSISFGFASSSQINDDPLVFPIISYEGQITDRFSISTVPVPAGISIQGLYKIDEKQSYALSVAFENRNFRLGPDAPVRNGVLRDQGFPIELSYRFRPSAKVEYGASIGYLLGQTITLEAANGSTILDRTLRPTPFIGLNAQFRL